jgi:hypothetical protein
VACPAHAQRPGCLDVRNLPSVAVFRPGKYLGSILHFKDGVIRWVSLCIWREEGCKNTHVCPLVIVFDVGFESNMGPLTDFTRL